LPQYDVNRGSGVLIFLVESMLSVDFGV